MLFHIAGPEEKHENASLPKKGDIGVSSYIKHNWLYFLFIFFSLMVVYFATEVSFVFMFPPAHMDWWIRLIGAIAGIIAFLHFSISALSVSKSIKSPENQYGGIDLHQERIEEDARDTLMEEREERGER